MFKHVVYEGWALWMSCVAFAVTVSVFLLFAVHAIRLRKERADHLSRLPLDD
jgi:hypothetical protein